MGAASIQTRYDRVRYVLDSYWFRKHGCKPTTKSQKKLALAHLQKDIKLFIEVEELE